MVIIKGLFGKSMAVVGFLLFPGSPSFILAHKLRALKSYLRGWDEEVMMLDKTRVFCLKSYRVWMG